MLKKAIYEEKGMIAVRYPKGEEVKWSREPIAVENYLLIGESKTLIITYGILFGQVLKAKDELLKKGVEVSVLKMNKIYPIVNDLVEKLLEYDRIFIFEDSIKNGSIGEHIICKLSEYGYGGRIYLKAIDGHFVEQSTIYEAWQKLGLDSASIEEYILKCERNLKDKIKI